MMRPVGEVSVYLHRAPIDMRLGRNGLAALAQEVIKADPFLCVGPPYVTAERTRVAKELTY